MCLPCIAALACGACSLGGPVDDERRREKKPNGEELLVLLVLLFAADGVDVLLDVLVEGDVDVWEEFEFEFELADEDELLVVDDVLEDV